MAHRGVTYSGFPENSLPGFQAVKDEGYEGVELDVRVTRDKEIVVFHDIRLERLTETGRGMVRTKTLEELRRLRLKCDLTVAHIPTLSEVFEIFQRSGVLINIEIKSEMPLRGRIEERVLDVIYRHGLQRHTIISSFNPLVIRKVQKLDGTMRTGFIYEKRLPNFNQRLAKGLIVSSWHPNFKGLTARIVSKGRDLGCQIFPWTVNEDKDIERMLALGVDGIITDYPNRVRALMNRPI